MYADAAPGRTYVDYFSQPRPDAPVDGCDSSTLSQQSSSVDAEDTTLIQFHDFSALSHTISANTRLDIDFVEQVISSTGPILADVWDPGNWQWTAWPHNVERTAASEIDYYPWLQWVVFSPAAHAVAAVRDRLYRNAGLAIPPALRGSSTTKAIHATTPRGVTDISHVLRDDHKESHFTAHEVKRAEVLSFDHVNVLDNLVHLAGLNGGWAFRNPANNIEEKARRLLSQSLDELINYSITHIVLSTQEQYVLLRLSNSRQFLISRVYNIHHSPTQGRDMAELVLFYTHSLLTRRRPYPRPPPSLSVYHVTIPRFSPRIFQPREALLTNGHLVHRAKLAVLQRTPDKPIPWPLSVRFDTSRGSCRHDGDIVIAFGRLVFWLFEARVVAKSAYPSSAADRLLREFTIYNFLRTLQGVVIPSLFGLYRNIDDGSSVLVTSYAGVALKDFESLCLKDRKKLLSHVVRLHQAGVQHNDLEPRNVTISQHSGPLIIDFDNATLDHVCTGLSCKELCEVSQRLGLDLRDELSRPIRSSPIPLSYLGIVVTLLILWMVVRHIQ